MTLFGLQFSETLISMPTRKLWSCSPKSNFSSSNWHHSIFLIVLLKDQTMVCFRDHRLFLVFGSHVFPWHSYIMEKFEKLSLFPSTVQHFKQPTSFTMNDKRRAMVGSRGGRPLGSGTDETTSGWGVSVGTGTETTTRSSNANRRVRLSENPATPKLNRSDSTWQGSHSLRLGKSATKDVSLETQDKAHPNYDIPDCYVQMLKARQ